MSPEQAATVTPGQAAHRRWHRVRFPDSTDEAIAKEWEILRSRATAAWEAAAIEAGTGRVAELVTEGNALRALLAVILDDFEASDRRPGRRMQFDRYRELAGIVPAAVTTGTDHLAAAITRLAIPDEEG